MKVLIITAVKQEAEAIEPRPDQQIVVGGVGRTNAAVATTRALISMPDCDLVLSAGIAGILPGADLDIGSILVAESCVYMEEGVITPEGFLNMTEMGFPLGDFEGNIIPVYPAGLRACRGHLPTAPIATVATCSGTQAAARAVVERTGASAEAMEGAAVAHAARIASKPALEVRTMSNTTGDRAGQIWDIKAALKALRSGVQQVLNLVTPTLR